MQRGMLVVGILAGTICGFILLVAVGVMLIFSPQTESQKAVPTEVAARVIVSSTPVPTVAPANTVPPSNTTEPTAVSSNTPIPTNEPTEEDMLTQVRQVMDAIPLLEVTDVVVNEPVKIVQVVFRTANSTPLDVMKLYMQDIVCAWKSMGIGGYRLRMGGKNAANVTLITAAIEADVLVQINCDDTLNVINWENATSEWSVASGIR